MSGTTQISFDLKNTTEFAGWLEGKSPGEYTIGIKATADPDVYEDSEVAIFSNPFLIASIDPTLNNCTAKTGNPTTIPQGFEKQLIFYPADGYTFSNDISVDITNLQGADATWVVKDVHPTPTTTLSNGFLQITPVPNATKYKIYANDTYVGYVDPYGAWHAAEVT